MRVNVPLQNSRGIFVYGEIIKMYTIRESNDIVTNYHVMETVKRKQNYKKSQSIEVIKHT